MTITAAPLAHRVGRWLTWRVLGASEFSFSMRDRTLMDRGFSRAGSLVCKTNRHTCTHTSKIHNVYHHLKHLICVLKYWDFYCFFKVSHNNYWSWPTGDFFPKAVLIIELILTLKMFTTVYHESMILWKTKSTNSPQVCLPVLPPHTHISIIPYLSRRQGGKAAGVEELDQSAWWDLGAHPEEQGERCMDQIHTSGLKAGHTAAHSFF